jgi:hypothetical protein
MATNFSPSVNIALRPIDLNNYFITSNVQAVFDSIAVNYWSGIRSINLIGAYGSGKSSFLSAFEQHVSGNPIFFEGTKKLPSKFHVLRIIGDYGSFIDGFAALLGVESTKPSQVLRAFEMMLTQYSASKAPLLLLVDEFGKLLDRITHRAKQEMAEIADGNPFLFPKGDRDIRSPPQR